MEHFQTRHLLLVEFLRGPSSGPCCFSCLLMTCHPQPHPEHTTLCGCLPHLSSHTQLTGPSHTSTRPWQSDPLVHAVGDAIQCCEVQGHEDYRRIKCHRFYHMDGQILQAVQSNVPRCHPVPWPNLVGEHPNRCQQGQRLKKGPSTSIIIQDHSWTCSCTGRDIKIM